jgi:uncharacterized protein YbdZ (MbtH family)
MTLYCLAVGLFAAAPLHAQPDSLWSRTFGGGGSDVCRSLVQTADGGYALAGYSFSFGDGSADFYLERTEENAHTLWSRAYGGGNWELCTSLIQTADNGFALAGQIYYLEVQDWDFYLVRTDENGDTLWSRTYSGQNEDDCWSLVQTADGGFALAGSTNSLDAGGADLWLVRTDGNGDSLWSRTYGGGNFDECRSLIQTADGGYALAGYTGWYGAGSADLWLVRTNGNGDSLWSRTFGGGGDEWCNALVQTADGGYALAGWTNSFGAGDQDFYLARTDENGDSLWSRTYGGQYTDWCSSLVQTADGGFALAGYTESFGAGEEDFWLVRTDENGDSLWSRAYGGEGDDECHSLIQTANGGYALAGSTSSFGSGNSDFWLVRLGPENSVPNDGNMTPLLFGLDGVYPNPFNQSTVVSYQLSVVSEVSLSLYDLSGREISNQQLGIRNPGTHRVVIDSKGGQPGMAILPSGLYILRLTDGRQSALSKVCLVK